jgi:hypothetical protein
MARITSQSVVIEDDKTGETVAEELSDVVTYSVDGVTRRAYLSLENAMAFREMMAPWMAIGEAVEDKPTQGEFAAVSATTRKQAAPKKGRKRTPRAENPHNLNALRVWAKERNLNVSERGRIAEELKKAYAAAHGIEVDEIGN